MADRGSRLTRKRVRRVRVGYRARYHFATMQTMRTRRYIRIRVCTRIRAHTYTYVYIIQRDEYSIRNIPASNLRINYYHHDRESSIRPLFPLTIELFEFHFPSSSKGKNIYM